MILSILLILCSPASEFVDKFLPMRQVPCPENRPGCLVIHWERPDTVWWDHATHWDDKTVRQFHAERVKFISEAFGWRGWEGLHKVWILEPAITFEAIPASRIKDVKLSLSPDNVLHVYDPNIRVETAFDEPFNSCRCGEEKQ